MRSRPSTPGTVKMSPNFSVRNSSSVYPRLRIDAGLPDTQRIVAGSSAMAVVGHWPYTSSCCSSKANERPRRRNRNSSAAIAAQPSPASPPTANANWFTLLPRQCLMKCGGTSQGVPCAMHSLGPAVSNGLEAHLTGRTTLDLTVLPVQDYGVLAESDSAQRLVEAKLAQHRRRVGRGLAGALIDGRDRAARAGFHQAQGHPIDDESIDAVLRP